MQKIFIVIALILIGLPELAKASCHEVGCYRFEVMGSWQVDAIKKSNKIAPAETHQIECWVTRANTTVKNPNMEVWQCTADQSKYDAISADPNFSILYSEQKVLVGTCSNHLYTEKVNCETKDTPESEPHGTWNESEEWK